MRIVAYFSEEAQPDARWLAYFEVKTKPSKTGSRVPDAANPDHEEITGGKPDPVGYLPLRFRGATREEAVSQAEQHWANSLIDLSQKREIAAAKVAAAKTQRKAS